MVFKNKIEERLNSVLIIDKLNNPNMFSKQISSEIENVLSDFMVVCGKPVVDVLIDDSGKYRINISVLASDLKNKNM